MLKLFIKIIFACLFLSMAGGFLASPASQAADGPQLVDVHKAKGYTCVDCHGEGPKKAVTKEKCQSCHGSYAELAKKTADLEPNPHYNHAIDIDCGRCHRMHEASVIYCQTCHAGLTFVKEKAK